MSQLPLRLFVQSSTALRSVAAASLMIAITGASAFAQQRIAGQTAMQSQAVGAPEISPALVVGGVALLVGGLLIVLGRRHAARA